MAMVRASSIPVLLFSLFSFLPHGGSRISAQVQTETLAVDTSYFLELGGVREYIEVRGASSDLPVLLYLHGGPCMPATPMLRYHQGHLTGDFIVVSWDQRGCGRSAEIDPRPEEMTLERHLQDAHELSLHLKVTYGVEKVLLVGHSWGSILGVELAQRHPEDYMAYVGVGQVVNTLEGERLAREELLKRARARGDTTTVGEVEAIPFSVEGGYENGLQGFTAHRRLLWMYGMMDHNPDAMLKAIAASEGYSTDVNEWMAASVYAQQALLPDILATDFSQRTDFRIPVFFFAGRHDFNTPSILVAEYVQHITAPDKDLVWFENSGHSPPWEEPEEFRMRLVEVVSGNKGGTR